MAAETLTGLRLNTAFVAEHIQPPRLGLQENTDRWQNRFPPILKNEKAARQWAASSLRENSSNGGIYRQNFLAKSYEPKKQGVKEFFRNNFFIFNNLENRLTAIGKSHFSCNSSLLGL
jgi:hypothetical protein